jgi:hypothetical protein
MIERGEPMVGETVWTICEHAGRVKKPYNKFCYLLAILAFIPLSGEDVN